ncbi:hypothetical protein LCGC14_0652220 [marine sediment metagenome]|uniref:Uncharacterized protein n=1 Tax=marine sediment metagenome TaxID=412755 RepID=A0A0F9R199_9ZZZZ
MKASISESLGISKERMEKVMGQSFDLIDNCNDALEYIEAIEEKDEWTRIEKIWIAFKLGETMGRIYGSDDLED